MDHHNSVKINAQQPTCDKLEQLSNAPIPPFQGMKNERDGRGGDGKGEKIRRMGNIEVEKIKGQRKRAE